MRLGACFGLMSLSAVKQLYTSPALDFVIPAMTFPRSRITRAWQERSHMGTHY